VEEKFLCPVRTRTSQQAEKTPTLVIKRIREGILDETFKPGDHLPEVDLVEEFEVSRSPVREALLALEKEGTREISDCSRSSIILARGGFVKAGRRR
jgi:DNA-binding GntR family transcriptional regulator